MSENWEPSSYGNLIRENDDQPVDFEVTYIQTHLDMSITFESEVVINLKLLHLHLGPGNLRRCRVAPRTMVAIQWILRRMRMWL